MAEPSEVSVDLQEQEEEEVGFETDKDTVRYV